MYFLSVNKKIEILNSAIKLYLNDKNLKVIDIDCGDKPILIYLKKFP
jgi:hypothetical protein